MFVFSGNFCQFVDGASPPPGSVIVSGITNESGYDSLTSPFYHSPTSPNVQQPTQMPTHIMSSPSPMRHAQISEQPSPMSYNNYHQQGYQVPCTPPGKNILNQFNAYILQTENVKTRVKRDIIVVPS